MLEPLTLSPEVTYLLHGCLWVSTLYPYQDFILCGQTDLPLNMNLNNNQNVGMAMLSPGQPDTPLRTEQSMFSPVYG